MNIESLDFNLSVHRAREKIHENMQIASAGTRLCPMFLATKLQAGCASISAFTLSQKLASSRSDVSSCVRSWTNLKHVAYGWRLWLLIETVDGCGLHLLPLCVHTIHAVRNKYCISNTVHEIMTWFDVDINDEKMVFLLQGGGGGGGGVVALLLQTHAYSVSSTHERPIPSNEATDYIQFLLVFFLLETRTAACYVILGTVAPRIITHDHRVRHDYENIRFWKEYLFSLLR